MTEKFRKKFELFAKEHFGAKEVTFVRGKFFVEGITEDIACSMANAVEQTSDYTVFFTKDAFGHDDGDTVSDFIFDIG